MTSQTFYQIYAAAGILTAAYGTYRFVTRQNDTFMRMNNSVPDGVWQIGMIMAQIVVAFVWPVYVFGWVKKAIVGDRP